MPMKRLQTALPVVDEKRQMALTVYCQFHSFISGSPMAACYAGQHACQY
jgi:hypothetical protein